MAGTSDTLSLAEAAEELERSYKTVRLWIKNGTLKAFKFGGQYRVRRSEIERLQRGEAA